MTRFAVRKTRLLLLSIPAALLPLCIPCSAASWPQWQGPSRNGVTSEPSGNWPPVKLWEISLE